MKRSGSPLEQEPKLTQAELMKCARSLVDEDGYNWLDFFQRLILGGFCCPYKYAFDGFFDLFKMCKTRTTKPRACWCQIPETNPTRLSGIKKFFFPQEYRCKLFWNSSICFKDFDDVWVTPRCFYMINGEKWIDYSASPNVCHNYWFPLEREEANTFESCKFDQWFINPIFEEINKKHQFV